MDKNVLWSIYDPENPSSTPMKSYLIMFLQFIDWFIPWKWFGYSKPIIGGDLYELSNKGILRFIMDKNIESVNNNSTHTLVRLATVNTMIIFDPVLTRGILSHNLDVIRRGKTYDRLVLFFGKGIFTHNDHNRWKKQRKDFFHLVNTFKLKQYSESLYTIFMNEVKKEYQKTLKDKYSIDLVSLLSTAGLVAFCEIYLGIDISENPSELVEPLNNLLIYINGTFDPINIPFDPRYIAFKKDRDFVHDYMKKIVRQAKESSRCDPTLLDIINTTKDENELAELMISTVLGGHEGVARLILGVIYSLCHQPNQVERLRNEIENVEIFDYDVIKLPYLKNIVTEGSRLFSPVWLISREPSRDITVKDKNNNDVNIKKGTQLLISPMIINRSDIWETPEVFDPDRFDHDRMNYNNQKLFFPFLIGPENCPGEKFAILESSLVIAGMFKKYNIDIIDNQIRPLSAGTFRLTDKLYINLTPR